MTIRYEEKAFVRYFTAYNSCVKSPYTDFWTKTGKTIIHLNIRPGMDLGSATFIDNTFANPQKYNFGNQVSFRIGVELELLLPFNRNKWAVVVEPAYRSYTGKTSGLQVDYKAFQFLLGGRYFLIDGPSKWYLTAAIYGDFPTNSSLAYENSDLSFVARFGASVSAGYRYKDRLGLELKYSPPQPVLANYLALGMKLSTASAILSFRIL
ncbi:MAG TPA: hypothetical protein VFE32_18810 [Puia sp.]|jgi:hypothetical protein|nr:hypothetical protein [Puia sp.]